MTCSFFPNVIYRYPICGPPPPPLFFLFFNSDRVFDNVSSCSTLFIMKTSHKSDELKKKLKRGEGVHKSDTYDVIELEFT